MDYLNEFSLTEKQKKQFEVYFSYLVQENEKINLTALTSKEDVYVKHFYDSLLLANQFDFSKDITLCDVGSGAGFPSIPLKIAFPNIQVTIIEPTQKRIAFLSRLLQLLEIDDIKLLPERAEDVAVQYLEKFDLVTARAVARLNILVELCMPFVKIKGTLIAMKGALYAEEMKEAKNAILTMGGSVTGINTYHLPNDSGVRALIKIHKEKPNSKKYPRNFSQIKKKPL